MLQALLLFCSTSKVLLLSLNPKPLRQLAVLSGRHRQHVQQEGDIQARQGLQGSVKKLHQRCQGSGGEGAQICLQRQAQQEERHARLMDPAYQRRKSAIRGELWTTDLRTCQGKYSAQQESAVRVGYA